ncbi:MAG: SIMPL domain-containing protein [Nocardioides sp.]
MTCSCTPSGSAPRTVTVTGSGEARVVPDRASVTVTLNHHAAGVADALAGLDSAVRAAGEVAREFTEATQIGSRGLNVWPAHDDNGRQVGFEARHTLSIGCRDITSAGKLLAALADRVSDRLSVDGVSLDVSDQRAALSAAREAALGDARAKATHLAELAGATLGEVLAMQEGGGGYSGGGSVLYAAAGKARDEMSIEPGESTIGASVQVTWVLG